MPEPNEGVAMKTRGPVGLPDGALGVNWTWVTDQMAVGGVYYSVPVATKIVAEGFTHIIDCRASIGDLAGMARVPGFANISYHYLGTRDDGATKGAEWFGPLVQTGLAILADPTARLLMHCAAGYNRGPSAAYALLRMLGYSMEECFSLIMAKRSVGLRYAVDAEIFLQANGLINSRGAPQGRHARTGGWEEHPPKALTVQRTEEVGAALDAAELGSPQNYDPLD